MGTHPIFESDFDCLTEIMGDELDAGGTGGSGSLLHKYRILGKAGEGTFSEVLKAVHIHTKKYVAIKRMKQKFQSVQQVNNLREVQALRRLNPHHHIIGLREIIFDRRIGSLSLVCELSDMNLYELIRARQRPLPELKVQHLIYQLFLAIDHTHRAGIYHRDIKPENILITNDTMKLADFGSCRSVYSKQPLTEYISTRWYRPPECLLTEGRYGYKMDLWAAGCVMYELSTLKPLFPGSNELDQLYRIHSVLGTPPERVLNKFYQFRNRQIPWEFPERAGIGIERGLGALMSKSGVNLLYKLLKYDPEDRITARLALRSDWAQTYKTYKKSLKQDTTRESSRDSGVDSPTPTTTATGSKQQEAKERKFNIDNKSLIPKYKFNAKKLTIPRQHNLKPLDSTLPKIDKKPYTDRLPPVGNHQPNSQRQHQQPHQHHHHAAKGAKTTMVPRKLPKKQILPKLGQSAVIGVKQQTQQQRPIRISVKKDQINQNNTPILVPHITKLESSTNNHQRNASIRRRKSKKQQQQPTK